MITDNKIIYSKYNTKIMDSYKIKEIEKYVDLIIEERIKLKYPITRSKSSYIAEWKAHNKLYRLRIKRTHTKDVDLEENINKCQEICYKILGF